MDGYDAVVVGAGISGLSFAGKAAHEGRKVLVLERSQRVGGMLHSERTAQGYWFELGAHTTYNSYGGFLDLVVAGGLSGALIERGPARASFGFLRGGEYRWLTPPKVLLQLNWLEAALHFPVGAFRSKAGQSVGTAWSRTVGPGNYKRVLGPFLSAVPSQSVDSFPAEGAGSLFKKRPRRKEFLRSFGFDGGLQRVCESAAQLPGLTIERGAEVASIEKTPLGLEVRLKDGRHFQSRLVAVAAPPDAAAAMLRPSFPAVADAISAVKTVDVESLGVVLPREKAWMPECAFLVPEADAFFSCVTRDPFPDAKFRGFAFHFRPGTTRAERMTRVCDVLRARESDFLHLAEKRITLPAPAVGHGELVSAIDRALAGQPLAVTGNFFEGLAIEDCVQRSLAEWRRISGAVALA